MKNKLVFVNISGVLLVTLIVKILGFFQSLTLANFFGVSGISDAYLIAQTIPGTIFQFVGMGLSACFVPVYLTLKNKDIKKTKEFTNRFLTIVVLFSIITLVFVEIFANQLVWVFASGFRGETFKYACEFTRISVFSIIVSAFNYSYISILQAEEKQISAAGVLIPYNIILIVSIVIAYHYSIYFLPIGNIVACIIEFVLLNRFVKKAGFFYRPSINFEDEYIKKVLLNMFPVMLGVAITDINTLVDKTVASNVIAGGITMLTYSLSLFEMVNGIVTLPITNVFYPRISKNVINRIENEISENVQKEIGLLIWLLLPVTFGVFLLGQEFVEILFFRGEFTGENVSMVANTLMMYGIGFIAYGLNKVFSQLFYALGDTKTPLKTNFLAVPINIILNLLLSHLLGLKGLALATTIASIFISIALYIELKKKIHISFGIIKVLTKCMIATIVMSIVILFVKRKIKDILLASVLGIILGGGVYLLMSYVLRIYNIFLVISKED